MEVGVFRVHLQLAKVTVERDDLAAAVAPTEEATRHHAILDLREVDELVVHGFGRNVDVHVAFGRVLVQVKQAFVKLKFFGEVGHGFQSVFSTFLLAVHLLGVTFLSLLFLFSLLGQTFCRRKAHQGRGEGECRPTRDTFHGLEVTKTSPHNGRHLKPRLFLRLSYASCTSRKRVSACFA